MANKQKAPAPAKSPALDVVRREDFTETYANNVRFESSVWDLKMILGLLDQSTNPHSVRQCGAIHLPWQQVKLVAYFLELNIIFQERANGKINIPQSVQPPPLEQVLPDLANEPGGKELLEQVAQIRARLLV